MILQVAILPNPNSRDNTFILTLAECKDSPDNLKRIISVIKDQLAEVQGMEWEGKSFVIFLFGDY